MKLPSPIFNRIITRIAVMLTVLLAVAALNVATLPKAQAATPNIAVGAGQVMVLPLHLSGQYIATAASVVKFAMPQACNLIGAGASARASGGTSPTLAVNVLEGGVTVLSAPIAVTAGTYSEGTITDSAIADEALLTVDLTIGGTSPTWNDITLVLTCARR